MDFKRNKVKQLLDIEDFVLSKIDVHTNALVNMGLERGQFALYGSFLRDALMGENSLYVDVAIINNVKPDIKLDAPYILNKTNFENVKQLLDSIDFTINSFVSYQNSIYYFPKAFIDEAQKLLTICNRDNIYERPFDLLLKIFSYFKRGYTMDFRIVNKIIKNIYNVPKYSDFDLAFLSGYTIFNRGIVTVKENRIHKLDLFDIRVKEGIEFVIGILELEKYAGLTDFFIFGSYLRSLFSDTKNKDIDVYCGDLRYVKEIRKRVEYINNNYPFRIDLSTHPRLMKNKKFIFWTHAVESVFYNYIDNSICYNVSSFENIINKQLGIIPDSYMAPQSHLFRMLKYISKGYRMDISNINIVLKQYKEKRFRLRFFIVKLKYRKLFSTRMVR